jgi:hypothetical protein
MKSLKKPGTLLVGVLLASWGAAGCASKAQLSYEAVNEVTGEGPVGLRGFVYAPAEAGIVKPNQSQVVGAPLKGESYTEPVADYVERALEMELKKSGFQLSGVADRNITGRIEAFGLDHSPKANRIDAIVQVNFTVEQSGQTAFEYLSTASKQYRNVIKGKSQRDMLIELTQVCISQFLTEAKAQGRL